MTGVVSSERNTKKPDRMSGFFLFYIDLFGPEFNQHLNGLA